MKPFNSSDFDYILLSGKPGVNARDIELHNNLYEFWQGFWSDVIVEVTGDRRKLQADDLVRQDCVSVVQHQHKIVAIHAYSFFSLQSRACLEHSYFGKYFSQEFMSVLASQGVRSVMTMEYFSVAKEWRRQRMPVSLATLLVALGLRIARDEGVSATVTAARADVPAAAIAKRLGGVSLVEPVEVHGRPTELMMFPSHEARSRLKVEEARWYDDFWRRRIDLRKAGDNGLGEKTQSAA